MAMAVTRKTEQQHYVPQFLLKGFASGKHDQVWVFDKKTDRVFRAAVSKVAAQRGFYDIKVPEGVVTMDPALGGLESRVAPIFKRIRRDRSIGFLSDEQRVLIALFIHVQRVRTQQWRNDFQQASEKLRQNLRRFAEQMGGDPDSTPGVPGPMTEEELRFSNLRSIEEAPQVVPYLFDKSWVLFEQSNTAGFYCSDSPVLLQNEQESPFYGNIGYTSEGIEIYLPISSDLCLCLMCPSFEKRMRPIVKTAELSRRLGAPDPPHLKDRIQKVETIVRGMDTGSPVPSYPENVLRVNSLEVIYSEQYVYSERDNFDLAREMIQKNPRLRKGPRMEVSSGWGPDPDTRAD